MPRLTREHAYARGQESARNCLFTDDLVGYFEAMFPQWRREFPLSAHLDYRAEIVRLWHERMAAVPDLTRYPECRGVRELVQAEYQGYLDGCGGSEVQAACHFNGFYFLRLRLQTRYFGFPPDQMGRPARYGSMADACTAVWCEDTPDGPLNGKNLDSTPALKPMGPYIPHHIPHGDPIRGVRLMGTASAPVLYDEEPDEIFPVNIDDILPDDIRTVQEYVEFRHHYRQFSGPFNAIYVDEAGHSVAIEHSNCRMGWRFARRGISAVTAIAYATPEMRAFKLERDRLSLDKRGWTTDCPDWVYWRGCDARYQRLLMLAEEEGARGPTVEGLARMLLDPEAPVPERISVANEEYWPGLNANFWTINTWVAVVFGPGRRTYRWAQPAQPDRPIFLLDPECFPGEGVAVQDHFAGEWARLAAIGKHDRSGRTP